MRGLLHGACKRFSGRNWVGSGWLSTPSASLFSARLVLVKSQRARFARSNRQALSKLLSRMPAPLGTFLTLPPDVPGCLFPEVATPVCTAYPFACQITLFPTHTMREPLPLYWECRFPVRVAPMPDRQLGPTSHTGSCFPRVTCGRADRNLLRSQRCPADKCPG